MRRVWTITISVVLLAGCAGKDMEAPARRPAPIALDGPVQFGMSQRSTVPIPGSDGKMVITIDDITAGQVLMGVSWEDGRPIVATRSMRPKDIVTLSVDGHAYKIKLKELTNVLIGTDTACFELWAGGTEGDSVLSEDAKIEKLLSSLSQLKDGKFVRNRQEHTADEAVAHMRTKWEWKKDEIKTAEDFIRIAGSSSSVSGEPYRITLADGAEMNSEDWFRGQLKRIEEAKTQGVDTDIE